MDINKLFNMVVLNEETKDVPILYIIKVFNCVLEVIGSGECFYKTEND